MEHHWACQIHISHSLSRLIHYSLPQINLNSFVLCIRKPNGAGSQTFTFIFFSTTQSQHNQGQLSSVLVSLKPIPGLGSFFLQCPTASAFSGASCSRLVQRCGEANPTSSVGWVSASVYRSLKETLRASEKALNARSSHWSYVDT